MIQYQVVGPEMTHMQATLNRLCRLYFYICVFACVYNAYYICMYMLCEYMCMYMYVHINTHVYICVCVRERENKKAAMDLRGIKRETTSEALERRKKGRGMS